MNDSSDMANTTNGNEEWNSDGTVSWVPEILFPILLYSFASCAGALFNAILVSAILSSKKLRTPPGFMIVVISLSELLLCLIFYPVHIVKMLHGESGIPDTLCKLSAVAVHIATFQTITSFPLVAFNRYCYITRQRYVYNEMFNRTRTTVYICLSWLFPLVIIAIPIIFSKPDIRFSEVFRICVIRTEIPIYIFVEWIYFLLLYTATMVIYVKVVVYIRSHVADRRQVFSVAVVKNGKRLSVQAAKMVAVASFGFSVCCLPYLTFRVIDPYFTLFPALVHRLAYGVVSLGSFVNPLLFTLSNNTHILAIKALCKRKSASTSESNAT